jgi:outer membrane protein OmpA-like peptidoglycan-associated protein
MRNSLITLTMVSLLVSGCASKNEVMLNAQGDETAKAVLISDIKQNDFVTESALHDAVRAKDLNMVQFLINQKIELNSKNTDGYTPLHIAVRLKEYEIIKLLIENGALVNTMDRYADTPLLDSTRDNYTKISKLLICNNAKRDVVDVHNMTPLHNSSKNMNLDTSKMLLADNLDSFCKAQEEMIEEVVEEKVIVESDKEETNAIALVGLYDALVKEFKDDFDVWNAELIKDDLLFRFNNPVALFETGKSDLKVGFTDILSDFFPRYLKIIEQYKSQIQEIRIEGHTSSEYKGAKTDVQRYALNKKLSTSRANEVRDYSVNEASKNTEMDQEWIDNTFQGYGMSYDDLIMNPDGMENVSASRRVDFKILKIEQ